MNKQCKICRFDTVLYHESFRGIYHKCASCGAVFLDDSCLLTPEEEKARYEKHNNDINDSGYRSFLMPVVEAVTSRYKPSDTGLDYGCGPEPVAAQMLKENGYDLRFYDPYFYPDKSVLSGPCDYIMCSEVAEHFKEPLQEFKKIKAMLKPGGSLICMTQLVNSGIDFEKWSYKNDPTHVIFYTMKSMEVIAADAGFSVIEACGRITIFS